MRRTRMLLQQFFFTGIGSCYWFRASSLSRIVQMYRQTYTKYGNTKTVYNGRRFDSKLEASVARDLDMLMKAGEFVNVEYQYRIPLYVYLPNGEKAKVFTYICDFRCEKPDGTYKLVEAKGHVTDVYRIKRKILDLVWLPDHLNYEFEEIKSR